VILPVHSGLMAAWCCCFWLWGATRQSFPVMWRRIILLFKWYNVTLYATTPHNSLTWWLTWTVVCRQSSTYCLNPSQRPHSDVKPWARFSEKVCSFCIFSCVCFQSFPLFNSSLLLFLLSIFQTPLTERTDVLQHVINPLPWLSTGPKEKKENTGPYGPNIRPDNPPD